MSDLLDLSGKVALITGAGQGVGRQIALFMAAHGAQGVIINDIVAERAQAVAAEVDAAGSKGLALPADITDWEKVQQMADSVREHMKVTVQSIKEQEKTTMDHSHLLERVCKEQNVQRESYADIVRGTCEKVVKDVGAKIDILPTQPKTDHNGLFETTNAMS